MKQTNPQEAADTLAADSTAVYLDVRTTREFDAGHPPGAYNIPVVFIEPGRGPSPNPAFQQAVEAKFDKAQKLLVGCQAGGRSMKAAQILESAGFLDVENVQGGFGGARDPQGNLVQAGWTDSGLPVETDTAPGRSYADLVPS